MHEFFMMNQFNRNALHNLERLWNSCVRFCRFDSVKGGVQISNILFDGGI